MNRPCGLLGPCARERACAVLRGPRCSNAPGLPGDVPWSQLEAVLSGRPEARELVVDPLAGDGGDSPAWTRHREAYQAPTLVRGTSAVEYVELHCHTNFSFLDGASHPEELVEEAYRLGLSGLAVTDHDGLYGVVRFADAARELGLPTVFGAELSLGLPGCCAALKMPMMASLAMPMLGTLESPTGGCRWGFRRRGVAGGRHGAGSVVEYFVDRGAGGGFVDEGFVGGEGGDEGL
jgi:PHP domain